MSFATTDCTATGHVVFGLTTDATTDDTCLHCGQRGQPPGWIEIRQRTGPPQLQEPKVPRLTPKELRLHNWLLWMPAPFAYDDPVFLDRKAPAARAIRGPRPHKQLDMLRHIREPLAR